MLFGTPEYMSPEQARGENVDHRVDVYAMGCILFQLVTGKVPFEAENFMGILSPAPDRAAAGDPVEALAEIGAPPELAGIIAKALAKSRAERWETIDEMANAIRALHGEDAQPMQRAEGAAGAVAGAARHGARCAPSGRARWRCRRATRRRCRSTRSKLPLILGGVAAVAALGDRRGDRAPQVDGGGTAKPTVAPADQSAASIAGRDLGTATGARRRAAGARDDRARRRRRPAPRSTT
jgi:hypothetical protein